MGSVDNGGKASLWLITPPKSDFTTSMNTFINETIPDKHFPDDKHHAFAPHLTLTSGIAPSAYANDPQTWLDGLQLPTDLQKEHNEAVVEFVAIETGTTYFKKLFIRASKEANFLRVATAARAQSRNEDDAAAEQWARDEFEPHLSLYYGDIDQSALERKMAKIELDLGFEIGSMFACCGGTLCLGAILALVDTTSKDVSEWKVLAERELPWLVWKMKRGLF